ncbi:hypothetical protein [Agilicoccus flavus]|uniref:hypothetical protein n=1 Tax=Agilicoccus flavus TaxID=2775968 RepID=UPI001CF65372|nr:hypothetical protein [Agilicoccus flavus]
MGRRRKGGGRPEARPAGASVGGSGGSGPGAAQGCALTVCHGCCCARTPDGRRDPAARARLAELSRETTVTVADCLGPCDDRDVVVVRPSARGRSEGARPVWLAWTGDEDTHAEVLGWVRAGGPGVADLPPALEAHVFTPARHYREDARAT